MARTCRRFAAAVRGHAFWLAVARRELLRKYGGGKHAALIREWVNPFYRFPEHLPNYQPWPFATFLQWLFPARYPLADAIAQTMSSSVVITLRTESSLVSFIEYDNHHHCTRWDIWDKHSGSAVPSQTFMSQEAPRESELSTGYYVVQGGKYTWCDATLVTKGRVWCGLVTEGKTLTVLTGVETRYLVPWVGQGFYRK